MDDLIAFLNARLDEDAERAYSGWGRDPEGRWENMDEGNSVMTPRAVLADIASKRQIIAELVRCGSQTIGYPGLVFAVRCLALPFASHPDYRDQWRP